MGQGRRQRWDEATARAVLQDFETSGLTLAAFARQRGVGVQRLRRWRNKFATPMSGERFVELVASPAAALAPAPVASGRIPSSAPVVVEWPAGPRLLVPQEALDALLSGLARVLSC